MSLYRFLTRKLKDGVVLDVELSNRKDVVALGKALGCINISMYDPQGRTDYLGRPYMYFIDPETGKRTALCKRSEGTEDFEKPRW